MLYSIQALLHSIPRKENFLLSPTGFKIINLGPSRNGITLVASLRGLGRLHNQFSSIYIYRNLMAIPFTKWAQTGSNRRPTD
jgi:hypothetical protein